MIRLLREDVMNYIKLFSLFLLFVTTLFPSLETITPKLNNTLSTLKESLDYSSFLKRIKEIIDLQSFIDTKQAVLEALNELINNPTQSSYDHFKETVNDLRKECWKLNQKHNFLTTKIQSYLNTDKKTADVLYLDIMQLINAEKKGLTDQFNNALHTYQSLWNSIKVNVIFSKKAYFSQGEFKRKQSQSPLSLTGAFLIIQTSLKDCLTPQ